MIVLTCRKRGGQHRNRDRSTRTMLAMYACAIALAPTITTLAARARSLSLDATSFEPVFESAYTEGGESRGWANWLITGRLILGQYPHCQPAEPGPSDAAAQEHLRTLLSAGVDCFTSLQAELPRQDDVSAWPAGGVQLSNAADRERWPKSFVRYAEPADAIATELGLTRPHYLHCGIDDLSVPSDGLGGGASLLRLLDSMLAHYEAGGSSIYLHCWGGRAPIGIVACVHRAKTPG